MKLRTAITRVFGGIINAIRGGCTSAAVVRGIDERIGKRGARGKHRPRNPFRGIACSNGSGYGNEFFRHAEGARDTRRARLHHGQHHAVRKFVPDTNWHPVLFNE